MSDNLLNEFKTKFQEMKQELGFDANLEELDKIFYFKDYILQIKFVSPHLERALSGRMVETLNGWVGFLHALVMPNPSSMINASESQQFTQQEKQNMMQLMKKILAHTTKNTIIGFTKNKQTQAQFFDESLNLWNEIKPEILRIQEKIHKYWEDEAKNTNTINKKAF